ncbi:MAG: hypothetical protein ABIJ26_06895 [Candidatus Margulisiibacteriota bacterium]
MKITIDNRTFEAREGQTVLQIAKEMTYIYPAFAITARPVRRVNAVPAW